MHKRFILLLVATGLIICLLLVQKQRDSASVIVKNTSSQPEKTPRATNAVPDKRMSEPSLPSVAEAAKMDSSYDLVQRIRAALKTGEHADQELVFNKLLPDLIKKNPTEAARLAESMESWPLRDLMLHWVAQRWAEQDPGSAQHWAEQLSNENERTAVLTDVCYKLAQTDARQATQMAVQYGLEKQDAVLGIAVLGNLLQQWAAQDQVGAIDWVKAQPAGERKDQLVSRLAMALAQTSPVEAAQMVATQIPAGNIQTEAAISVINQWALHDLPGARAWAELFPEGPLRERALSELKSLEQYLQASNQAKK